MAYLVALRVWQDFWADRRLRVAINSDNLSTLFMGAQMRSKASPLVSKEVALLYSESAFEPRIFQHLPGITNRMADIVSRLSEPGNMKELPIELHDITPTVVPIRTKKWYRILSTS